MDIEFAERFVYCWDMRERLADFAFGAAPAAYVIVYYVV
jgi:hypothetical protein